MFEDSFVESQATHASAAKRWTMLGSTMLQTAIAATLITIPLLHPEKLYFHVDTPLVFTPPPPRPPIRIVEQQAASSNSTSAMVPAYAHPITTLISRDPVTPSDNLPDLGPVTLTMNTGDGLPSAITGTDTRGPQVNVARPEAPKRIHVTTGVSAGLLLAPIQPIYPAIARAARVSGTVVVEAVISRSGTVESLHVVSGPEMLRAAALDALRSARYRPYLLNGEPTEVQTTFTVNFRLGA
jgi:protein TonB